ncbi:hypothetical protein DOT66_24835 [Ralstonia pseudosolanacearum]|nr:hypothetical protein DOT66_24835 [Ralstonia pseudosolanacearum]
MQCTELALGNQTDADYIERIFHDCAPTVLIGMPLILLDLSDYLVSRNVTFPSVLKIGLGGELLKPNQAAHMFRAFPNAKLCGTVYASNECGLIGSWDGISPTNEICVADESVIVEIVDEKTHEPIEDINQPGLAVVTSIVKEKQPVIRYVTGDRVEWCSPKGLNRRMRLLGRATIRALNVEGVLISEPELWEIAAGCGLATSALNVQAIVSADDTKTSLLFRLVMPSRTPWNISDEATVRAALLDYWPALHEAGVNVCVDRVTPTDSRKGTDMPKHKALVDLR